ncbi:putative bifunctional diguanylate cyclase/phosphodiesterase [Gaiella sp.]|uniref:putative bifunctional diguanylate cyclase/phosphodiesterase n=1 Tax=Gaiella sp. TaxID=2663207 RepID=UPI002D192DD7|nr:EAL domain-containing protein [Gaiella sp.]HWO78861.1 EAL domain-containing protein [Gaiella sp.]
MKLLLSRGRDGRTRNPSLVLRFTLFTAVGLAVTSVAIFLVVRGFVTGHAEDAVERNTRFVAAAVLSRQLTPSDFDGPVSAERRRQLDRIFGQQVLLDDVDRATLYGRDGVVSYSTDAALIGRPTHDSDAARAALSGGLIKTVVEPEHVGDAKRTVLKQVVPISFGHRPAGTFVSSRDYAPIARSIRATFVPIAAVLEILVLALFASFFPVLRRATRQMGYHIDAIEHLALHDSLTGLPNRVLFRDRIDQVLADSRRSNARAAVMLLDLDGFKEINDVLGHANGDELLRSFSARLRRSIRETDTVARLGGDEFGIVLRVDGADDVLEAAERIHGALDEPFAIGDLSLDVGASIGGAVFPDDAVDPETLVRFADVAMYAAKRSRSGVELYDPAADDSSREALALGGEIRQALEDGSIVVHFQPKVEVASGRIVGAEALARWNHPQRGIVLPAVLLPVVEKAGVMRLLTDRVLRLAVAQAAAWRAAGRPIEVAVNIDVRALLDSTFPSAVDSILAEAGLPAELLTLEITETSLMADPTRSRHVAQELAAIGVRLSIDDFGTGYSSLGHLTALPLSELKIDRSFVSRMTESPTGMTIVRTILDLGANLDLAVVAEGIESPRARSMLLDLGCGLAQGYELGRPVPAEVLTDALGDGRAVDEALGQVAA